MYVTSAQYTEFPGSKYVNPKTKKLKFLCATIADFAVSNDHWIAKPCGKFCFIFHLNLYNLT